MGKSPESMVGLMTGFVKLGYSDPFTQKPIAGAEICCTWDL
jgi:hypothetical protein